MAISQLLSRLNASRVLLGMMFLMLGAAFLPAQNAKIKRGDRCYEAMSYPLAIRAYERGLKKGKNGQAMERLADAYRQVGNTARAEYWYAEAVKQPAASPMSKFHYGQMLKSNGKYAEARRWFEAYLQTGADPHRAARAIESCDFALDMKRDSGMFSVKHEKFNRESSDFGPLIYQQGLLFVSERPTGFRKLFNLRNNNYFYDIHQVSFDGSKRGYKISRLKGKVNRRFHDGPAALNSSQDQLYFTRSFMVKDKRSRAKRDHSKLKLMVATKSGRKWKPVQELPFNSQSYSCGHPAISADGNTLVFASDIPGGFGGTDLYVSRKADGNWSTPENLGSNVNTEGNESFPYIHDSGALFFASDGHVGLGGLDIFSANAEGSNWGQVRNLGYPLNSAADDFSMTWAGKRPNGYFASNRDGDDDIYQFKRGSAVEGTVVDARTGLPVKNAQVRIMSSTGKETLFMTGADGAFTYMGEWGKDFVVEATCDRYLETRERVTMGDLAPTEDKAVTLKITPDLIFMLKGQISDAKTKLPLQDATVRLIGKSEEKLKADDEGKYFKRVAENTEYTLLVMQPGYVPKVFAFSTEGKTVSEDFVFNAALEPGNYLLVEGKTFQNIDKQPLEAVNVHAVNDTSKAEIRATRSRKDGRFWQVLDPAQPQYLVGSKIGFFSSRAELPAPKAGRDTTVLLDMPMFPYEVGTVVKIIYYEYNKAGIVDSASKDLYEIIYFLNDNPEASVELSSHTDSRGGNVFNEKLSQQRADAAVNFIVSRGISPKRIVAKGYGESKLTNKCTDGMKCSDREHGLNRRTEIKVIRIDATQAGEPPRPLGFLENSLYIGNEEIGREE